MSDKPNMPLFIPKHNRVEVKAERQRRNCLVFMSLASSEKNLLSSLAGADLQSMHQFI